MLHKHALNVMERPEWNAIYWRDESELDEQKRRDAALCKRDYAAKLERLYALAFKSGEVRSIPQSIAVKAMLGMINMSYIWFNPAGALAASAVADHFVDMLLGGFAVEQGSSADAARLSEPRPSLQPIKGLPQSPQKNSRGI